MVRPQNETMPSNIIASEELLDERAVAKLLHVSVGTVRRWRLFHKGPRYIKVSDNLVRYRHGDVESYLASRPCGGGLSQR